MEFPLQQGDTVLVDTNPILYYWNRHQDFFADLDIFFNTIYQLNIQCTIPVATYSELISIPMQNGNSKLAAKCREYLTNSSNFSIYPFNIQVSDRATQMMFDHDLRLSYASKLATAELCGADFFLTDNNAIPETNDIKIIRLTAPQKPSNEEQ